MELDFTDKIIKSLCEDQRLATKKLGADCARKLRARLSDLLAARTVAELKVGNPHPLKGNRAGEFSVRLAGGRRLVFKPSTVKVPKTKDGAIDWGKIESVTIVFIGDYHD